MSHVTFDKTFVSGPLAGITITERIPRLSQTSAVKICRSYRAHEAAKRVLTSSCDGARYMVGNATWGFAPNNINEAA